MPDMPIDTEVVACELPAKTVIDRELVDGAFFIDSYRVCRRIYLLLIAPFHKWGVQRLLSTAAQAGRL